VCKRMLVPRMVMRSSRSKLQACVAAQWCVCVCVCVCVFWLCVCVSLWCTRSMPARSRRARATQRARPHQHAPAPPHQRVGVQAPRAAGHVQQRAADTPRQREPL
jgi:hypothetical protein